MGYYIADPAKCQLIIVSPAKAVELHRAGALTAADYAQLSRNAAVAVVLDIERAVRAGRRGNVVFAGVAGGVA